MILLSSLALLSVANAATIDSTSAIPVQKTSDLSYFVDASFTYWYVKEEGMDVAESAVLSGGGQTFLSNEGTVFQQFFSYEPGFQVGGGIKGDGWGLSTKYTWVRSKNKTNKSAPTNQTSIPGIGVWNVTDWFLQTTILGKSPTATHLSSDCHLALDIGDLLAENPIYEKKHVKVSGALGLRTVWIRQKMNIAMTQATASIGSLYLPEQPIHSLNNSHSWGIGPKIGLDTQFLLPKGFWVEGQFAASLLYTRFSSIKHYEQAVSTIALNANGVTSRMGSYSAVRPVIESGLGIGWKTDCWNKYSFDLKASYDFSLFWGQNVIRKMLDEYWTGTQAAASDLYLQGLTVEACFSF